MRKNKIKLNPDDEKLSKILPLLAPLKNDRRRAVLSAVKAFYGMPADI